MKRKLIWIAIALFLLILILANGDFLWAKLIGARNASAESKNADELLKAIKNTSGGTGSTGNTTGQSATTFNPDRILGKGSKGLDVKGLQAVLNGLQPGPSGLLSLDGNFGPATQTKCKNVLGVAAISLRSAVNQYKLTHPAWQGMADGYLKTVLNQVV